MWLFLSVWLLRTCDPGDRLEKAASLPLCLLPPSHLAEQHRREPEESRPDPERRATRMILLPTPLAFYRAGPTGNRRYA